MLAPNRLVMNRQSYNNQVIIEYLLGSLSEAEAERLDELGFTDDDFAENLKAVENDLVDAFARGELAGAQLEKFESYYLATPLRREKAIFAKNLQAFAKKTVETPTDENSNATAAAPKAAPERIGFFSKLTVFALSRPVLASGLAFAALAFLLLGGWLLIQNSERQNQTNIAQTKPDEAPRREQEPERQLEIERSTKPEPESARSNQDRARLETKIETGKTREQQLRAEPAEQRRRQRRLEKNRLADRAKQIAAPRRLSVGAFVLLPPLRGNHQVQTLSIPAQTAAAIGLQLEANDYIAYQAVLRSQADNRILWRSGKRAARNNRFDIRVPARLLKPQIYTITISGVTDTGATEVFSDYSFRVVQ